MKRSTTFHHPTAKAETAVGVCSSRTRDPFPMDRRSFVRLLKRIVGGFLKAIALWRAIRWLLDFFGF